MLAPKTNTYVDGEISRVVLALQNHAPTSEEYGSALEKLSKLHKIRQEEKPDRVSSDTIASVAANLLVVALIIRHEHLNVITSKAMSFVTKTR